MSVILYCLFRAFLLGKGDVLVLCAFKTLGSFFIENGNSKDLPKFEI